LIPLVSSRMLNWFGFDGVLRLLAPPARRLLRAFFHYCPTTTAAFPACTCLSLCCGILPPFTLALCRFVCGKKGFRVLQHPSLYLSFLFAAMDYRYGWRQTLLFRTWTSSAQSRLKDTVAFVLRRSFFSVRFSSQGYMAFCSGTCSARTTANVWPRLADTPPLCGPLVVWLVGRRTFPFCAAGQHNGTCDPYLRRVALNTATTRDAWVLYLYTVGRFCTSRDAPFPWRG